MLFRSIPLLALVCFALTGCTILADPASVVCDDCDSAKACKTTYYADTDGDTVGDANGETTCELTSGFVETVGDCDDTDGEVATGFEELCDGKDNNCDTRIDEGCPYISDPDGDGYCEAPQAIAETYPEICSSGGDDCEPQDSDVSPGSAQGCGAIDTNCNGQLATPNIDDFQRSAGIVGIPKAPASARLGDIVAQVWLEQKLINEARLGLVSLSSQQLITEPIAISPPNFEVSSVRVVALPELNRFLVAVVRADSPESPWTLFYQLFSGDGTPIGEPIVVDTVEYSSSLLVAADGEGGAMFVYNKRVESSVVLFARALDLNQDQLGVARVVGESLFNGASMAWHQDSGTYFIAGSINNAPYGNYFGRVSKLGSIAQPIERINVTANRLNSAVLHGVGGEVYMVWYETGPVQTFVAKLDTTGEITDNRRLLSSRGIVSRYRALTFQPATSSFFYVETDSDTSSWYRFDSDFGPMESGTAGALTLVEDGSASEIFDYGGALFVSGSRSDGVPGLQFLKFGPSTTPELIDNYSFQQEESRFNYLVNVWTDDEGFKGQWFRESRETIESLQPNGEWVELREIPPRPQGCLAQEQAQDERFFCHQVVRAENCTAGGPNEDTINIFELGDVDWEIRTSFKVDALYDTVATTNCRNASIQDVWQDGDHFYFNIRQVISTDDTALGTYGIWVVGPDGLVGQHNYYSQQSRTTAVLTTRAVALPDGLAIALYTRDDTTYETSYFELDTSAQVRLAPTVLVPNINQGAQGLAELSFDGENVIAVWFETPPGSVDAEIVMAKLADGQVLSSLRVPGYTQFADVFATPEYGLVYTNRNPFIGVTTYDAEMNIIADTILDFGASLPAADGRIWHDGQTAYLLLQDFGFLNSFVFKGACVE